jgi:tight adherence protein C
MNRLLALCTLLLFVGCTLLLNETRWFARRPMLERLRPYVPGGARMTERAGILSVESFREVVGPLSRSVGDRLARLLGVHERIEVRLERIHSPLDVTTFRIRQLGWSVVGFGVGCLLGLALPVPLPFALLLSLAGPLLAFLAIEQQLASASQRWQRRLFLELPIVTEQLAMLISAGFSLHAALNRIAARGRGTFDRDLTRVLRRVRQGLSDTEALREWAEVAQVEALHRLIPILALNREAGDLGRLLSQEARAIRRDAQREMVETVERRGEQVWIPVTVATLLPGVIFLAVPFVDALRMFAG